MKTGILAVSGIAMLALASCNELGFPVTGDEAIVGSVTAEESFSWRYQCQSGQELVWGFARGGNGNYLLEGGSQFTPTNGGRTTYMRQDGQTFTFKDEGNTKVITNTASGATLKCRRILQYDFGDDGVAAF